MENWELLMKKRKSMKMKRSSEFKYEEKLPVGIDSHLNLYQYETFCFTNMKVTLKGKKIFKTEDRMLVFY